MRLLKDRVVEQLRRTRRLRGCNTPPVDGVDCCLLDPGPQGYRAGRISDARIFEALADGCKADGRIGWSHAAVGYALQVLRKGGPLMRVGRLDLPGLAKATLFSVSRDQSLEAKEARLDPDSLGLLLLGGALAFLGGHRVGDARLEFFLVPPAPLEAYEELHAIAVHGGLDRGLGAKVAWLLSQLPLSLEPALLAATAWQILEAGARAEQLRRGALASGRLVLNRLSGAARRPMLVEGLSLSDALLHVFSEHSLRLLLALTAAARGLPDTGQLRLRQAAEAALAACVDDMSREALSPCGFHVYRCARELRTFADRLADALKRGVKIRDGGRVLELAEKLVSSIAGDLGRRCRGQGLV